VATDVGMMTSDIIWRKCKHALNTDSDDLLATHTHTV